MKPKILLQRIELIFKSWRTGRRRLIEEAHVYLVETNEIQSNRFYKRVRNEQNALAPGRIRNETLADKDAGKQHYRKLRESILTFGFDPLRPLVFVVRKKFTRIALHQGHHRLGVAIEIG